MGLKETSNTSLCGEATAQRETIAFSREGKPTFQRLFDSKDTSILKVGSTYGHSQPFMGHDDITHIGISFVAEAEIEQNVFIETDHPREIFFESVESNNISINHKPVQCPECGKIIRQARNLSRHYQACHQSTILPCDYCDSTFTRSDNLQKHVREKHGIGEKLACPMCFRSFRSKVSLEKHVTNCQ